MQAFPQHRRTWPELGRWPNKAAALHSPPQRHDPTHVSDPVQRSKDCRKVRFSRNRTSPTLGLIRSRSCLSTRGNVPSRRVPARAAPRSAPAALGRAQLQRGDAGVSAAVGADLPLGRQPPRPRRYNSCTSRSRGSQSSMKPLASVVSVSWISNVPSLRFASTSIGSPLQLDMVWVAHGRSSFGTQRFLLTTTKGERIRRPAKASAAAVTRGSARNHGRAPTPHVPNVPLSSAKKKPSGDRQRGGGSSVARRKGEGTRRFGPPQAWSQGWPATAATVRGLRPRPPIHTLVRASVRCRAAALGGKP